MKDGKGTFFLMSVPRCFINFNGIFSSTKDAFANSKTISLFTEKAGHTRRKLTSCDPDEDAMRELLTKLSFVHVGIESEMVRVPEQTGNLTDRESQ